MTINVIRLIYFISNGCIDIVIRTRCKFFNTQIDPPGDSTGPGAKSDVYDCLAGRQCSCVVDIVGASIRRYLCTVLRRVLIERSAKVRSLSSTKRSTSAESSHAVPSTSPSEVRMNETSSILFQPPSWVG